MNIKWEKNEASGEPLLLIQGLGYARWSWDPVVPGLAERYRVVWFDNRGIGESDKPAGPYTAAANGRGRAAGSRRSRGSTARTCSARASAA